MGKVQVGKLIFILKSIAAFLLILAAIWLCVYVFAFLPNVLKSDDLSDSERSSLALALLVMNIGTLLTAVAVLTGGLLCIGLSKKEQDVSLLDGNTNANRKKYILFRVFADLICVALSVFLLVLGSGLGGGAMILYRLPTLVAAGIAIGIILCTEAMQVIALQKNRKNILQE